MKISPSAVGTKMLPCLQGHHQLSGKSDENKSFWPNQSVPSIYIMIELCYFSLDQWEIRIHLLWGKCFNISHHCDPHLNQTKFNDLLPLTIHGVLVVSKIFWCFLICGRRLQMEKECGVWIPNGACWCIDNEKMKSARNTNIHWYVHQFYRHSHNPKKFSHHKVDFSGEVKKEYCQRKLSFGQSNIVKCLSQSKCDFT